MTDDEQHEAYGAMRHAMTQHVSHRASDEIAQLRAEVERLARERDEALKERGQFLVQSIDAVKEIERLTRERGKAIKNATSVCDSYAEENQRLFERAEAAERHVATLREALGCVLRDIDFMVERGSITDIRNDVIYVRARAALAKATS